MKTKEFKLRRDKLLKDIDHDSIVVVFSAQQCEKNYPYRQNSDFYYLTGFIEPDAIAVLTPESRRFILFSRPRDITKERWDGPYIGQKKACRDFGADQAFAISEANKILPRLLTKYRKVYSNIVLSGNYDLRLTSWLKKSYHKLPRLVNLGKILDEIRLKKSNQELKLIRKAVDITSMGHLRAMLKCRPKMFEFELEAEILHEFTRIGGCKPAFPTIIASGINACTLHYSKNNKRLASGEVVLIDAGAKYEHYSADVSRTFPVNGRFTKKQRAIYEIVLTAQLETIKEIRPGVKWDHLQSTAEQFITKGLIDQKLLHGNLETLLAKQKFKPFFMHKIGHWLGLDTHDVGQYKTYGKWRTIEPGMVFTVEPGIYINPLNLGIRIEDNILVTDNGCEVLSSALPKRAAEIEKIMRR